jgi:hypothetical protein
MGDYEDYWEEAIYGYNENDARNATTPEKAARIRAKGYGAVGKKAKKELKDRFGYSNAKIDEVIDD